MDSVGEGEGGKIWENGIETCKISCIKRDASPGSMQDTGCLGLVHWDDPEGHLYFCDGTFMLRLNVQLVYHIRVYSLANGSYFCTKGKNPKLCTYHRVKGGSPLTLSLHACSVSVMSNSLRPLGSIPPGSSVHGIVQARILKQITISCSRGSS